MSVFQVIDAMKARGWYIQPQLAFQDSKENVHLSINPASVRWVEPLLADLRACVEDARSAAPAAGGALQAALAGIDLATLDDEALGGLLTMAGIQGAALPARMAEINEILNALSPTLRERVLTAYLNDLFHQPRD